MSMKKGRQKAPPLQKGAPTQKGDATKPTVGKPTARADAALQPDAATGRAARPLRRRREEGQVGPERGGGLSARKVEPARLRRLR